MTKLYQPVQIGAVHLDHRIVQAPLTRLRSYQPSDVPNAMMVKYYAQRASKGGLQIAEANPVAIQGSAISARRASIMTSKSEACAKWSRRCMPRAASSSFRSGMSAGRATSH